MFHGDTMRGRATIPETPSLATTASGNGVASSSRAVSPRRGVRRCHEHVRGDSRETQHSPVPSRARGRGGPPAHARRCAARPEWGSLQPWHLLVVGEGATGERMLEAIRGRVGGLEEISGPRPDGATGSRGGGPAQVVVVSDSRSSSLASAVSACFASAASALATTASSVPMRRANSSLSLSILWANSTVSRVA